ncbi:hypothetical protein ACIQV3_29165 [Streptomyces sp. NPDC099050]|uniref:hypothetical protein n=1 Tax=Streptomyces sp. NPDC099050 TaxID=3366100 RepID=UPI0038041E00
MTEQHTTGPVSALPEDAAPRPAEDAVPRPAVDAVPQPAEDAVPQPAVDEQGAARAAAFAADPLAANPFAAPQAPEVPAAPKDRRKLFAALRWTAAVLVFAAVGTGVAYQVTQPERTDIPGLSTKADGRLDYPALERPALPAGAALPFAEDNPLGIHYAGLTQLLLPPPTGSKPDSTLKLEKDEVVTVDTFLAEYVDTFRGKMKAELANEGLRQIVARGWTTPDGTRTRVYLLRFHSPEFVSAFKGCEVSMGLNGALVLEADPVWRGVRSSQRSELQSHGNGPITQGSTSAVTLYQEAKPTGDDQTKLACIQSGDIQALVLQTRKGEVASVPFHQTVILQHQLLG